MAEGIRKRKGKKGVGYEASVYLKREGKKLRKTFPTLAAAKQWRADAQRQAARNALRVATKKTVLEAAEEFLAGIENGSIRSLHDTEYKPGTVRTYEYDLRQAVLPRLGERRLGEVTRRDVRELVKTMRKEGRSDSAVRNALDPLSAIYENAIEEEEVDFNPVAGVRRGRRTKPNIQIVPLAQAAELIGALEPRDRALWACAFFAGLRRGELRALRSEDVDWKRGEILVRRSWDDKQGDIAPKTAAGERRVPIVGQLRPFLEDRIIDGKLAGPAFVFGRTPEEPFLPSTIYRRSRKAWAAAGLEPTTLRQARHTFASVLIDAGIRNPKVVQETMGHTSVTLTLDVYGHLFPDARAELRDDVDAYLGRRTPDSLAQKLAQMHS